MMIPTRMSIYPNQEKRIINALKRKKKCCLKVKKGTNHEMLLTPEQWTKYQSAANKKPINLSFEHKHLVGNMNHKGGFLPLIAAALAPIIGGVAGGLIEKEIAGSGIRIKKQKRKQKKKSTGDGMFLNPYYKGGKGMYLSPYRPRK